MFYTLIIYFLMFYLPDEDQFWSKYSKNVIKSKGVLLIEGELMQYIELFFNILQYYNVKKSRNRISQF